MTRGKKKKNMSTEDNPNVNITVTKDEQEGDNGEDVSEFKVPLPKVNCD